LSDSQTLRQSWNFDSPDSFGDSGNVFCGRHRELKTSVKEKRCFENVFTEEAHKQGRKKRGAFQNRNNTPLGVQRFLKATVGSVFKTLITPLLRDFIRFAHGAASISDGSNLDATVSFGVHVPLGGQACLQ
jgi:hypothetical protein